MHTAWHKVISRSLRSTFDQHRCLDFQKILPLQGIDVSMSPLYFSSSGFSVNLVFSNPTRGISDVIPLLSCCSLQLGTVVSQTQIKYEVLLHESQSLLSQDFIHCTGTCFYSTHCCNYKFTAKLSCIFQKSSSLTLPFSKNKLQQSGTVT